MTSISLKVSYPFSSFERGGISLQSGQNVLNQKTFRSKVFYNDARFLPGHQYLVSLSHRETKNNLPFDIHKNYALRFYFYDKNKTYLGKSKCIEVPSVIRSKMVPEDGDTEYLDEFVFQFPEHAYYLRIVIYDSDNYRQTNYTQSEESDINVLSPKFEIRIQENPYLLSVYDNGKTRISEITITSQNQNRIYSLYDKINLRGLEVYGTFLLPMSNSVYYIIRILDNFKVSNFETLTLGDSKTYYVQWMGKRGSVTYSVDNATSVRSTHATEMFSENTFAHPSDTSSNDEESYSLHGSVDVEEENTSTDTSGTNIGYNNWIVDELGSYYQITDKNKHYVTLIAIGDKAIQNGSLVIPSSVTDRETRIAYYVNRLQSGCLDVSLKDKIEKLTIPETLGNYHIVLESQIFEDCYRLNQVHLNGAVENIGYRCFKGIGISSIYFPKELMVLGEGAFEDCSSLKYIVFQKGEDKTYQLGRSCFYSIAPKSVIYVPSSQRTYDFYADSSKQSSICIDVRQTKVIVGKVEVANASNQVTYGYSAYKDQYGVLYERQDGTETLSLSNIPENIIDYTVPSTLLTPDGFYDVTKIFSQSVRDHSSLQRITFSGSLEVEEEAFQDCKKLISVQSNYPIRYQEGVFKGCENLQVTPILQSLTQVPDELFKDCKNNSTLSFSPSLTYIGDSSFSGILVESIALPESLEHIGEEAFDGTSLSEVRFLGTNLKYVGEGSFSHLKNDCNIIVNNKEMQDLFLEQLKTFIHSNIRISTTITTIVTLNNSGKYEDMDGVLYVLDSDPNIHTATIVDVKPKTRVADAEYVYQIPDTITVDTNRNVKYDVVSILPGAFGPSIFTKVILNDHIREIPSRCFENSKLMVFEIPETAHLLSVGDYAFSNTSITDQSCILPVVTVGKGIFKGCKQLQEIWKILTNIDTLTEEMFSGCTGVNRIIFDHKINFKSEDSNVFYNCNNVKDVIYMDSTCNIVKGSFINAFRSIASETLIYCSNIEMEQLIKKDLKEKSSLYVDREYHFETMSIGYGTANLMKNEENKLIYVIDNIHDITVGSTSLSYSLDVTGSTISEDNEIHLKQCKILGDTSFSTLQIPAFVLCEFPGESSPRLCSVCTLEDSIFENINDIQVQFPMTITTLPRRCFYKSKIRTLKFPKYLIELGEECFRECENLPAFRSSKLPLPETVSKLGKRVFMEAFCDEPLELPPLVTDLPVEMCYHCSSLNKCYVFAPTLVPKKCEGKGIFYRCKGKCAIGSRFEFYAVSKDVAKSIDDSNFYLTGTGCVTSQAVAYKSHSLTYPRTTLTAGSGGGSSITGFVLDENDEVKITSIKDPRILQSNTLEEEEGYWSIPSYLYVERYSSTYPVTTLGTGSLSDVPLIGITLSNQLKNIEPGALQSTSLSKIKMGSFGGTMITAEMFSGTPNLKEIVLPIGITKIQKYGFKGSSLNRIIVEGDVFIESDAFSQMSSAPKEIFFLGKVTFEDVSNFTSNATTSLMISTKFYFQDPASWSSLKSTSALYTRVFWVTSALKPVKSLSYVDSQGLIYSLDNDSKEEFILDSYHPLYPYMDYETIMNYDSETTTLETFLKENNMTMSTYNLLMSSTNLIVPTYFYVPSRGYLYPVTRARGNIFDLWNQVKTISLDSNLIPSVDKHEKTYLIVNDILKGDGASGVYARYDSKFNVYTDNVGRYAKIVDKTNQVNFLGMNSDPVDPDLPRAPVTHTVPKIIMDVKSREIFDVKNYKRYTPVKKTTIPDQYTDYQGLIYEIKTVNGSIEATVIGYTENANLSDTIEIPDFLYLPEEDES